MRPNRRQTKCFLKTCEMTSEEFIDYIKNEKVSECRTNLTVA